MKQAKTNEMVYQRLRTTGSQPARFFGLAKVHKSGTPLRPVLSMPGSSYENLNKFLSLFFGKLPGANIETDSKDASAALEAIKSDEDELVVSFDVKSLYTNVPVEEAIEIALKELYSSGEVPEMSRSVMKSLLRLAVTNVHFKCNNVWYTQSDGLAMGASLAVVLANLWMKTFKKSLQKPNAGREKKLVIQRWYVLIVTDALLFEGKGLSAIQKLVLCKMQDIAETEYLTMQDIVWIFSYCADKGTKVDTQELKLFKSYVDECARSRGTL